MTGAARMLDESRQSRVTEGMAIADTRLQRRSGAKKHVWSQDL